MNLKLPFISILTFIVISISSAQEIDHSFKLPTPITSAKIYSIKFQDDGKILVGGDFAVFGNDEINSLIRLNSDGSVDETFSVAENEIVKDIKILSNGDLIVISNDKLVKLNSSGALLENIDTSSFIATAIQTNEKIVAVGYDTKLGLRKHFLRRYNNDLTIDATFKQNNEFDQAFTDVEMQGDNIVVSGRFSEINGIEKNDLARFDTNGNIDNSFDTGSGTGDLIGSITIQENGKILLGNTYIYSFNGNSTGKLVRLNVNGDQDFSFNYPSSITGPVSEIYLKDTTIIIASPFNNSNQTFICKIDTSGNFIDSFQNIEIDYSSTIVIDRSSDVEILTNALSANGNEFGLSKYDQNGILDTDFNPEIGSYGYYETGDYYNNKLIVAGNFLKLGEIYTTNLALIEEDGSINSDFIFDNSFKNTIPSQVMFKNDTTIYLAYGSELVKLNSKGDIDGEFITQAISDPARFVEKFNFLENGGIITASGNGIFKLNSDGSKNISFTIPELNGASGYFGMGIQSNALLYQGFFTTVNGLNFTDIVKLDFDGVVNQNFIPNLPSGFDITEMYLLDNDEILLFDYMGDNPLIKTSSTGIVYDEFRTNYNNSISENFYILKFLEFKTGVILTGNDYNSDIKRTIKFINTDGTVDENFNIPSEIIDVSRTITPIEMDEKSLILFSRFEIDGESNPSFAVRLIYNDIPIITGTTKEFSTEMNVPVDIAITDLIVTDNDNSFPDDFTFTISTGDDYTLNNTQVIPNNNFNGTLSVPVFVNDGMNKSEVYNITILVENTSGISSNDLHEKLQIFPNPVNEEFNVLFENDIIGEVVIKIINNSGSIIKEKIISKNSSILKKTIDVSNINSGIYFVEMILPNKRRITQKLIIE